MKTNVSWQRRWFYKLFKLIDFGGLFINEENTLRIGEREISMNNPDQKLIKRAHLHTQTLIER